MKGSNMAGLSRRAFLARGSVALGVAGAAAAVPGVHSVLETKSADAAERNTALSPGEAGAADLRGPLVAQVTDPRTGEITVYQGKSMFVLRDPGVVARLQRTALSEARRA